MNGGYLSPKSEPAGATAHIIPHSRIIVHNGIIQRRLARLTPSPYQNFPHQNIPLRPTVSHEPPHRFVIRRPANVIHTQPYPIGSDHSRGLDQFPRADVSSNMLNTRNEHWRFIRSPDRSLRNVRLLPQVPRIAPPDVIDVDILASQAEHAINSCGISIDRQIWFEAIMMTLSENMTVAEASDMIGVHRRMLFRLMNIVRYKLGFPALDGLFVKQFSSDSVRQQLPTQRVIRVDRGNDRTAPQQLSLSRMSLNMAKMMPAESGPSEEESLGDGDENAFDEFSQADVQPPAVTGVEMMKENLEMCKNSIVTIDEAISMSEEKMQLDDCDESVALEKASIVSMSTVLKEERRKDQSGTYEDLEEYFRNLLLRHKQEATPSIVSALTSFVADKKANFNQITEEKGVDIQQMRTMLRMALFERRLEHAQIDMANRMEVNEMKAVAKTKFEYRETSDEWLSGTVAEMSVPITVTNINIVFDLAEKKKERACLKALFRLVSPQVEQYPMIRVVMERLIMDGYKASSGVPKVIFEFWSKKMASMLACLLKEYPSSLAKWRSLGQIRRCEQEAKKTVNRRESRRIKERESAVPDSLYLDRIFKRDLKKSFLAFLKELKWSGIPMRESTVVSIGQKILGIMDEKRVIKKESWMEWLVQEDGGISLFDYLDADE